MKKIIAIILAVLMMATLTVGFTSCGDETDADVVKVIDIPLTVEEYAFAVAKGNSELLKATNDLLAEIQANGKFNEIVNKYFGDGTPSEVISATEMKTDGSQLIVATNAAFAPFEYKEGAKYYGLDLEIMALLAEKLGKELYIYNMEFDAVCLAVSETGGDYVDSANASNNVSSGIADIAAAGLTVNDIRKEILDFSTSYYNASQMLIVAGDDTTFDNCKTAADVEAIFNTFGTNVVVGVQKGTTGEFYCKGDAGWGFDGFGFTTKANTTGALAVQDIVNGNAQYVIIDEGPAKAITANVNATN